MNDQLCKQLRRLWTVCCLLLVLQVNAQNREKLITLNLKDVRVSEAVSAIRKQTDLEFFYSVDDLNRLPRVTVAFEKQTLSAALTKVLAGTGMSFQIEKNVVTISPAFESKGAVTIEEKVQVSGKITGPGNQPLSGVTIMEAGSGRAITSDAEGNYTLAASRNTTLRISYVGMKTQLVVLNIQGSSVTRNIQLQPEEAQMTETVVTGYQNIAVRNMAGAYSTVKAEDIKIAGVNSIDRLLQGQLPGVAVTQPSGIVGTKAKVRTRGTSTLLGSQDPVWVVDGIVQNDPIPFEYQQFNALANNESSTDALKTLIGNTVSFLNVEDIQDITVLKDASSTAIYGVKAANGVIVITTKKGKAGRTSVNYATNITVAERPSYNMFNLMNSKERIDVSKEIFERGLQFQATPDAVSYEGALQKLFNKEISQEQFAQEVNRLELMNTDWFKLLYRTPVSNNHTVNVSGGADRTTYYASLGFTSQLGNTIGNDLKRYTGLLKVNTTFSNKLRAGFNISASSAATNGFYKFDPFAYAYNTSRAIPNTNPDGTLFSYVNNNSTGGAAPTSFLYNVINERNNTGATSKVDMVQAGFDLEYKFTHNFTFQSLGNYSISNTTGQSWAGDHSNYITSIRAFEFGSVLPNSAQYLASRLPIGGVLNELVSNSKSYTFRNTLTYTPRLFNGRDNLTAMAGMEARSLKYDGYNVTNYGYMPDRGRSFVQLPSTVTNSGIVSNNTLYSEMLPNITDRLSNYLSYFGTIAYNLNKKYVFNASLRTDASNRFGQDANHRFLPVWAAGFKWNIADENLFSRLTWLNQFSLRATYGFQGNVAENFSPELIAQIPKGVESVSSTSKEALLKIYSLAYKDLRWEKNKTVNFGLDFSFFNNRFFGSVDYYSKKTEDAIIMLSIPYEYGLTSMPINGGNLNNHGYEITLNVVPIRNKNFNWNIRFNTARNFNEITQSGLIALSNWQLAASGSVYKNGYPVSAFWAFDFQGLDGNGLPIYGGLEKDPKKVTDATLGMQYMGQLDPKFTGGFSNSIQYRNFSMNLMFNVALGQHKFLPRLYDGTYSSAPYPAKNLPAELVNRWRKPGDEKFTVIPTLPTANIPQVVLPFAITNAYTYQMYDATDIRVVNASFVRCQNLAIGYRLPEQLLRKTTYIKQCSVQASATNLFYVASKDLHGVDPEVNGNSLPVPRTFSLTLNVGF